MAHDPTRLYGKYRGKVRDNVDPLFLGRLMVEVPQLPGEVANWALPCTPYAGPGVGFYAMPPIGASVWIEFEGGDPDYPIWAGCFWQEGETIAVAGPPIPEIKVLKTDWATLTLNDLPGVGGFTLRCDPPAVDTTVTIAGNAAGITLTCGKSTLALTPETVSIAADIFSAPTPDGLAGDEHPAGDPPA